jgi:excisionase family DNA binding protein
MNAYSVAEAARFLGVSKSWLNKLRVSGGGPQFLKLGRRVVYEQQSLTAWIEQRRRSSTSR